MVGDFNEVSVTLPRSPRSDTESLPIAPEGPGDVNGGYPEGMRTGARWSVSAMSVALAVTTLSGCAPFNGACPAIGWMNAFIVELGEDRSDVAGVRLCTDGGCAPSPRTPMLDATQGAGQNTDPGGGDVTLDLYLEPHEDGSGEWVVRTGMSPAEVVTVQLLDREAAVVQELEVRSEWTRVGGSERCGGPSEGRIVVAGKG